MEITAELFLKDYNNIKKIAFYYFENNDLQKCCEVIEAAAYLAYELNQFYCDDELENLIIEISKKIPSTELSDFSEIKKTKEHQNKWVFYDCFGWDNRGLTQQYLRALKEQEAEILFIFENYNKNHSIDVIDELSSYENVKIFFVSNNKSYEERVIEVEVEISRFSPQKAILHLSPWSVLSFIIWQRLTTVERYFINLTDHAFWLGKNTFDICIEFRNYGYTISKNFRNIPDEKLLLLPYYPIIDEKNQFQGFPTETNGKKLIVSGSSYYKVFGEDDKFFKLVARILEENEDAVLLFAGSGDRNMFENLLKKYQIEDKVYLLGDRKDISQVVKHADLYLATYPITGGLMGQFAMSNNIPIIAYSDQEIPCNSVESLTILQHDSPQITYAHEESFFKEVNLLLRDKEYRDRRTEALKGSIISPQKFNESFASLVKSKKSFLVKEEININIDRFSKIYLEVVNHYKPNFYPNFFKSKKNLYTIPKKTSLSKYFDGSVPNKSLKSKIKRYMKRKLIEKVSKIILACMKSDYFTNLEKQYRMYEIKKLNFKFLGSNHLIPDRFIIKNAKYITIGENFSALSNLRIEAWDYFEGEKFSPEIIIGDNVIMNTDIHIGAINKVKIGNNVLMASRIYISDHSHGEITSEALRLIPSKRPLISTGPVIIEDNVWIGEGVAILPNVTIGKNCIIGANAVVTKSFPENSVIAGIPAKIIKVLK